MYKCGTCGSTDVEIYGHATGVWDEKLQEIRCIDFDSIGEGYCNDCCDLQPIRFIIPPPADEPKPPDLETGMQALSVLAKIMTGGNDDGG